jgi:hypothetical protein
MKNMKALKIIIVATGFTLDTKAQNALVDH